MSESEGRQMPIHDDRAALREAVTIRARGVLVAHLRAHGEALLGEVCDKLDDHQIAQSIFRREDEAALSGVASLEGERFVYTGPSAPVGVVFVGEDNPHEDPERPRPFFDLYDRPRGSAGARLREVVLGCSWEVYFGPDVWRANLCRGRWSAPAARAAARRLAGMHPGKTFVLLGAKVAEAFGIYRRRGDHPFDVVRGPARGGGTRVVALLPHPSGRCRVWSEPGAVSEARACLRAAGLGWLLGEGAV